MILKRFRRIHVVWKHRKFLDDLAMKLANIFPSQALMAPVLTAALSLASIFSPSTGNAEPAKATTVSTNAPSNVSIPPTVDPRIVPGSNVEKQLTAAYDHSNIGPSVVILLNNKEDSRKYKPDVDSVVRVAKLNNVPLKIFAFKTAGPSTVFILLDEIPFRKPDNSEENYSVDDLSVVVADAVVLYGQSQRYKAHNGIKTSAIESAPDIASNIR